MTHIVWFIYIFVAWLSVVVLLESVASAAKWLSGWLMGGKEKETP